MNKLSKDQIVGILVFVLTFIYASILEITHFTDSRLKSRLELMPYIIVGIVFFIYAIYMFSKDEKKK